MPATISSFTFPNVNGPGTISLSVTMGVHQITCTATITIAIDPSKPCEGQKFTLTCGSYSVTIKVLVTPEFEWVAPFAWIPDGDFCVNDTVELRVTGGLVPPYQWEYRDQQSAGFKPLATFRGNREKISFSANQLFGEVDQKAMINNPVYFRVSVGNCPKINSPLPIRFLPESAVIQSFSVARPLCNESTGSITINTLTRPLISGETLTITIRKRGDPVGVVKQSTNITEAQLPLTFENIRGGHYEALIESFLNAVALGCGEPYYTPIDMTAPAPLTLTQSSAQMPSCALANNGNHMDGGIVVTSTGGTPHYFYSLTDGNGFSIIDQISGEFKNMKAGRYTAKAKDTNGCESPPLTIMLNEPPALSIEATAVPASCANKNDGVVIASASGGTPDYRYRINADPYSEADVLSSLYHGTYIASVMDAHGCVQSQTVTVAAPPVPSLDVTSFTPTTCGLANGSVDIRASGETEPFQYQWTNQRNDVIAEFSLLTDADSGTYILKVTDQLECVHDTSFTFSPSYPPKIKNKNESPPSCAGRTDGSVHLEITHGTEPYHITWPDGSHGPDRADLASGNYHLLIQDKNACRTEVDVSIPEPIPVTIATKNSREPNCRSDQKGMIEVSASGGSGVFTYRWNTKVEGPVIDNCTAGTYTVTVTDSQDCVSIKDIALTNYVLEVPDQATCQGHPVVVKSPVEHSINTWSGPNGFQSTDSAISINEGGIYRLSVTTSQGCIHADTFKLRYDNQQLNVDFLMTSQAFVGDTIVAIDISWPIPTLVHWTFDAHAKVIDEGNDYSYVRFDEPGIYTIKLRAAIGACGGEKSQTIHILEKPEDDPFAEEEHANKNSIIRVFTVHPNPVQGILNVEISLHEMRGAQLALYHLGQNRRMMHATLEKNTAHNPRLDLSTLPPGAYVLTLKAGPELKTIRIIKL